MCACVSVQHELQGVTRASADVRFESMCVCGVRDSGDAGPSQPSCRGKEGSDRMA